MLDTIMRITSFVVVSFLVGAPLLAQQPDPRSDSTQSSRAAMWHEPAVWTESTPYVLGGAAALTVVFLANDQRISDDVYAWRLRNRTVDKMSPIVSALGSGGAAIALLASVGAYGYFADDARTFEAGKIGLESFVVTGVAAQILKQLGSRERPDVATRNGGFWAGPFGYYRQGSPKRGSASFASFPSGHATTAFSLAATFTDVYDDKPWVGYASYSLATLVAVSRVTEHQHWASDCVVGAVVGVYGTKLVESFNAPSSHLSILPRMDSDGYGLLVSIRL